MFVDALDLEMALAELPDEAWTDWDLRKIAEAMMEFLTSTDED